jgi:cyclase
MNHFENGMFFGASPFLFEKAKELRSNSTPAESELWRHLAKKKLGVKFRRQHPIYNFIADFYCHSNRLVIELDGGIHDLEENKSYDAERDQIMNDLGLTVLRFKNEEVLNTIETVIERILQRLKKNNPAPPLNP